MDRGRLRICCRPAHLRSEVAALDPAQRRESFLERCKGRLPRRAAFAPADQRAHPPLAGALLRYRTGGCNESEATPRSKHQATPGPGPIAHIRASWRSSALAVAEKIGAATTPGKPNAA